MANKDKSLRKDVSEEKRDLVIFVVLELPCLTWGEYCGWLSAG